MELTKDELSLLCMATHIILQTDDIDKRIDCFEIMATDSIVSLNGNTTQTYIDCLELLLSLCADGLKHDEIINTFRTMPIPSAQIIADIAEWSLSCIDSSKARMKRGIK